MTSGLRQGDGQLLRALQADDLEDVGGPSPGEVHHRGVRVARRGVHRVGRAEPPGGVELGVVQVDRDDAEGASEPGPADHVQPHPAGAEDRDRVADPYARRVDRGADPGHRAAPDDARGAEGDVAAHDRELVLVHEHLLGEAADPVGLRQGAAGEAQPLLAVGRPQRRSGGRAGVGLACEARRAAPAELDEAGHHVVAHRRRGRVRAHRGDDSGHLVPQDRGQRDAVVVFGEVQVAVAQPGGPDLDEDLRTDRGRDAHVLDREAPAQLVDD